MTLNTGYKYIIYRRYRQFNELESLLDDRFVIDAGSVNIKDRILPDLPGMVGAYSVAKGNVSYKACVM